MDWNKVKVKDMPAIQALLNIHTNDLLELFDRDVELISLITGQPTDVVNAMTPKEFGKLRTELYELVSKQPKSDFNTSLKIGGRRFTFIVSANNVVVKELAELHLLHITEDNFYSKVPYVIAVFAKERGWFKKKLTFTEKAELFKELPVDVANGIALFFCKVSETLERSIKNSLEKQMTKSLTKLKEALDEQRLKSGGGSK